MSSLRLMTALIIAFVSPLSVLAEPAPVATEPAPPAVPAPAVPATAVPAAVPGVDRLIPVEGAALEGQVLKIDNRGVVTLSEGRTVELQGLRRVERPGSATPGEAHRAVVHLSFGGELRGAGVTVEGDRCELRRAGAEPAIVLPLQALRGLAWPVGKEDAARAAAAARFAPSFELALADASVAEDRLYAYVDSGVQSVPGVLQGVDGEQVRFEYGGQARTVKLPRVYAVTLGAAQPPPSRSGQCRVLLRDGSAIWGRLHGMEQGRLTLSLGTSPQAPTVALPWSEVTRVEVRSDRLAYLSDLDPLRVTQRATLTYPWRWQRDRAVLGEPMRIKGAGFERGLGVHANNSLSFANEGFTLFRAAVGLDDHAGGKGDCVARVRVDGETRFEQRLRGSEAAVEVRIPIEGARELTLEVDEGEGHDLADHVNWANARLIRER